MLKYIGTVKQLRALKFKRTKDEPNGFAPFVKWWWTDWDDSRSEYNCLTITEDKEIIVGLDFDPDMILERLYHMIKDGLVTWEE